MCHSPLRDIGSPLKLYLTCSTKYRDTLCAADSARCAQVTQDTSGHHHPLHIHHVYHVQRNTSVLLMQLQAGKAKDDLLTPITGTALLIAG